MDINLFETTLSELTIKKIVYTKWSEKRQPQFLRNWI